MKLGKLTWAFPILVIAGLTTLSSNAALASSVTVTFDTNPSPDPACVDMTITAQALAEFSATDDDQEELEAGGEVNYRFKWEYNGGGGTISFPGVEWTAWSTANKSIAEGSYSPAGNKTIKVYVEAKVIGAGAYSGIPVSDDAQKAGDVIQADSITVGSLDKFSINKTDISVTATVTCCGENAGGLTVTFSGDMTFDGDGTAVTNDSGVATITASTGATPSASLDSSSVTASVDNGLGTPVTDDEDFTIVEVNDPTPVNPNILVGNLPDNDLYSVVLTYTVSPAISGVDVEFEFEEGEGEGDEIPAELEDEDDYTDDNGEATVRVRSGDLRETATVKCSYQESSGSTDVTFEGVNSVETYTY